MSAAKTRLTRLCRKRSPKTGNEYFAGRLGTARVLLFRDRDQPDDGDEV